MNPHGRRADVIVQATGSETLVYDQLRDAAHSLSAVTGYVYQNADGTRSVEELSDGLSAELGVERDVAIVSAALWELERVHLLESPADEAKLDLVSRRTAVRRFGTAALGLAAISSIAAPTPAMARSAGGLHPRGGARGKGPGGGGPPGQNKAKKAKNG